MATGRVPSPVSSPTGASLDVEATALSRVRPFDGQPTSVTFTKLKAGFSVTVWNRSAAKAEPVQLRFVARQVPDDVAALVADDDVDENELGAGSKDGRRRLLSARKRASRDSNDHAAHHVTTKITKGTKTHGAAGRFLAWARRHPPTPP